MIGEVVGCSEWHQIAFCKNRLPSGNEPIPVKLYPLDRARLFMAEEHHIMLSSPEDVDSSQGPSLWSNNINIILQPKLHLTMTVLKSIDCRRGESSCAL